MSHDDHTASDHPTADEVYDTTPVVVPVTRMRRVPLPTTRAPIASSATGRAARLGIRSSLARQATRLGADDTDDTEKSA